MRKTIKRTQRFVERVFTPGEREYCDARGINAAQHYAARFAAKEATLKALQTGWSGGISWHDVEVELKESGAPIVTISGKAKEIMDSFGATRAHVSLSHTAEHAIATVILES
jgi:holo-[acyl-carrier protein] synthase